MYSYEWDASTGGYILNSTPLAFSKEPRPVYYKELDILGFDAKWNYPKSDAYPLMWAEANNYYYRGRLVAKTKGGSICKAPELIFIEDPEPSGEELKFVDIPAMIEKNRNILESLTQETIKKIYNTYLAYQKKIDIFYVAFSGGKDSIVTLDLVQRALPHNKFKWLSNSANKAYFNAIIKDEFPTEFGGDDVDKIIEKLESYTQDKLLVVMNKIFKIARLKGIRAMTLDKEGMVKWIQDIIKTNNLRAIVFIWDEFTKYFENNMSDLTTFQRLAELSETDPFYLVIVTHKSEGIFAENDNDKKLLGRFVSPTCLIELPDTMAFRLMAEAMEKTKDASALEEWNDMQTDLYNRTTNSRELVLKQLQKRDPRFTSNDLGRILPMHPYAALLLKHLSAQFASNQRSMFDFIKNDKGDDIHGFQWYIKNYGPEDDNPLLTIDMLWNFFYENGKEQLASDVKTILNHYNNSHPDYFQEAQRRVLKTILLMTAIRYFRVSSVIFRLPS